MLEEKCMENKMYQVSTLQALALGYSRAVITVEELIREGDTGLGTFEDVNGEMIVMDGHCYRADRKGHVTVVAPETGVPFAAVARLYGGAAVSAWLYAGYRICTNRADQKDRRGIWPEQHAYREDRRGI